MEQQLFFRLQMSQENACHGSFNRLKANVNSVLSKQERLNVAVGHHTYKLFFSDFAFKTAMLKNTKR